MGCKQAMRKCVVGRHIRHVYEQYKVRSRRDPITLQHARFGGDMLLKFTHAFGRLHIQCNLDNGSQANAYFFRIDNRHLAFNHALCRQLFDPAQAGGWGNMNQFSQLRIGMRRVNLEHVQDATIKIVKR